MKKTELIFSAILVPLDYLMLILAGLSAYFIRYSEIYAKTIREVVFDLPLEQYLNLVWLVALCWLPIFALNGLYTIGATRKKLEEFSKVIMACSTGMMAIFIYIFFQRELFDSRFIVLAAWGLSIVFVIAGRLVIRFIQKLFLIKKIGSHKVVILGNGKLGAKLVEMINQNPRLGYQLVAHFNDYGPSIQEKLEEINKKEKIDEIIQADPEFTREKILEIKNFADEYHLGFMYAADLLGIKASHLGINTIADYPFVEVRRTPLDGWGRIYKRLFDFFGSLILIILFSPLMLLVALGIKLDSRGPVFFKCKRIGEKGKPFLFIKFRSMKPGTHELRYDAEFQKQAVNLRAGTPMIKFQNDPRITHFGKIIRKLSLDELPNLFLSLIGTMSLVGPRPHEKEEVAKYQKHHKKVLELKPGLTGLAQISGRSDLDFEEEVKLDTFYVENWSLVLDIIILLKTPFVMFKKRKAL